MTSATVEIWKDTGYTEGCMEVPKTSSTLSNPDFTFSGLEISSSSLFSEVKVKDDFESLYDCSYLRMTLEMNNGDDVTVYGWIDSVSVGSDSASSPMTRIQWHVDMWRTYISKVTFGSGIVKRRPSIGDIPPQPYGNRYTIAKTPRDILPDNDVKWVFLNVTRTVASQAGDSYTTTHCYCYPVNITDAELNYQGEASGDISIINFPSLYQTVIGMFDEWLKIDPDAIFSAFISPVPPAPASASGNVWTMTGWKATLINESTSSPFGAFAVWTSDYSYPKQSFTTMALTTDTDTYTITDLDRVPIGSLPWGISVSGGTYRIVNCDTSMYIKIWFTGSLTGVTFAEGSQPSNGLEFNIPLKALGVTSNAKSSYVYSGQQEFDREQMAIQREQAMQSGFANMGNQAVQGAAAGAMLGALGGPVGMAGGAAIGAVSSAVGGAIGTTADYFIQGAANDKMMAATIRQKAHQTASLMLPSAGYEWLEYGHAPQLIPVQWDDYSITQRAQDMQLYGAHVDEPRTSCQDLLTAGGPLQIANLVVTGSVPVQAKTYIKQRLANGVRIV